nr:MAG: nonstructural protein NS1 [Bee densovirus 5]
MGSDILRTFESNVRGRVGVHDVYFRHSGQSDLNDANSVEIGVCQIKDTLRPSKKFDNWIIGRHFKPGFDHIHLFHLCQQFSEQARKCQCRAVEKATPEGFIRKRRVFRSIGGRHIGQMLLYLQKEGRQIDEIHIANETFTEATPDECDSEGASQRHLKCEARDCYSCAEDGSGVYLAAEPDEVYERANPRKRKASGRKEHSAEELGEQLVEAIKEIMPIDENHFKTSSYFAVKFRFLLFNQSRLNNLLGGAWHIVTSEFNELTMDEILAMQMNNQKQFLGDGHDLYYSINLSSKIVYRLLLNQLGHESEVKLFIERVYKILDKAYPKVNSMTIISEPSAGKTYLLNSLGRLIWNKGNIRNHNNNSDSFPYQDAYNKRINFWNECHLEGTTHIEMAKMIWEGQGIPINRKHEKGCTMKRTPLFVSSNKDPWSMRPEVKKAFMDRTFYYRWKPQLWLKELDRQLHPLLWCTLFEDMEKELYPMEIPGEKSILQLASPASRSKYPEEEWSFVVPLQ